MWTAGRLTLLLGLGFAMLASSSAVIQLQTDNFNAHLETCALALVGFCIPWYEPCQKLSPEFYEAAKILKDKNITLISIDCTLEDELCNTYNVTSYPTVRIFRGPGKVTRYREKRTAQTIISYMIRQTLPIISVVDETNIEEILSLDMATLIAYINENDQKSRDVFTAISDSYHDQFLLGISSNAALAKTDKTELPFIVLYNPLDQVNIVFDTIFEVDKIESFLKRVSTPLVGKFGLEIYHAYTKTGIPVAHIFAQTEEERQNIANMLKHVAERYKGKVNFVTIDSTKFGFFASVLNLIPDRFPAFVIEDAITGESAPLDQNEAITASSVEALVESFVNRRLKTQMGREL